MLETRHLQIVEAIAREGTVTAAARTLHLTQPALSHALAQLEARLGLPLFRRAPRGMSLTPEGERLLQVAALVLPEVRAAELELRLAKEGHRGVLEISTECYTCYHWLPPILAHFQAAFPDVEVRIAPDSKEDPAQALLDGRLDVAIMHSAVRHPDLVSEELFVDELAAMVQPDHPLSVRPYLEPRDLRGETIVLHSDPDTSPVISEFLEPAGERPFRVLELQLTEAILAVVKSGLGVTVMAPWAVRPDLDRGTLKAVSLGKEGLHRSWRLVTRKDRARRATVQALARLLIEESGVGPRPGTETPTSPADLPGAS